jgi:hypothetical protein
MGSGFDNSIYLVRDFTRRNYNWLLHFQDCCIYDTQAIVTLSSLTHQLINYLERRLSNKTSNPSAYDCLNQI